MKKNKIEDAVIIEETPIEQPKTIIHYLANQLIMSHSNIEIIFIPFYDDNTKGEAINKTYKIKDFNPEVILIQDFRAIRILEDNIPYIIITEDIGHSNNTFWNFDSLIKLLF